MTVFPLPALLSPRRSRLVLGASALCLAAACSGPMDFDMRGKMGSSPFDTAGAAQKATEQRPKPDDRGILSYPNYQVAVARRGDTLTSVAERIGLPVTALARYNGIAPGDALRPGEIVALPRRVAEPSPATGAAATGPIRPASEISITELASNALDSAAPTTPQAAPPRPQTGVEPIRHKVERGETAFTIARLYNVSVRALSDWNALGSDLAVREGQFLLIPVVKSAAAGTAATDPVTEPGSGSPTPTPPSASRPLPAEVPTPAAAPVPTPPTPDLGSEQTRTDATSDAQMRFPVEGKIIREYAKGRNDGIDITAAAGTPVRAAASGVVAAITTDADNVPIIVIKHPDNLLTVYANLADITVAKDDRVSRGQSIGKLRAGSPPYLHFEVRRGFDSTDPMEYLP